MRLPTGEVEVATASALENAFRCGLADARTPVRAVSSPVWTSLAEVAEIDTSDPRSLGSLLPVAVEEPAVDLADGRKWDSRTDIDARMFHPRVRRIATVMVAVASLGLAIFCGTQISAHVPKLRAMATRQAAQHLGAAGASRPSAATGTRKTLTNEDELFQPANEARKKLDAKDFERELRDMDKARRKYERTHARRGKRSRTPVEPPEPKANPFSDSGHRMDPLNGAL